MKITSDVFPLLQRGVRGDFFKIKSLSISLSQREKLLEKYQANKKSETCKI